MIFREPSNAAFRFSLRRPGAEIMGGAFKRPPPPAGGGKSRGPAGRGLIAMIDDGNEIQLWRRITFHRCFVKIVIILLYNFAWAIHFCSSLFLWEKVFISL